MWLLVGLGNPGRQYEGTRHNVGFEAIQRFAERHQFGASRTWKNAEFWRGKLGEDEVLLAKPLTFMNLSGDAVLAIARYYKIDPTHVIVCHDELDFAPGIVRIKVGGGHGGHNGLRSIMAQIGAEFVRVRVGIGKPVSAAAGANFVLSRFDGPSRRLVDQAIDDAVEGMETVIRLGLQTAMNQCNRRVAPGAETVDTSSDEST